MLFKLLFRFLASKMIPPFSDWEVQLVLEVMGPTLVCEVRKDRHLASTKRPFESFRALCPVWGPTYECSELTSGAVLRDHSC